MDEIEADFAARVTRLRGRLMDLLEAEAEAGLYRSGFEDAEAAVNRTLVLGNLFHTVDAANDLLKAARNDGTRGHCMTCRCFAPIPDGEGDAPPPLFPEATAAEEAEAAP